MLGREDLDTLPCSCGCQVPGHAPRYLHSRCHTRSRRAHVGWDGGCATVRCGVCRRMIVEISTAQPDFSLPTEPVEVFYQGGELHLVDAGTLKVTPSSAEGTTA